MEVRCGTGEPLRGADGSATVFMDQGLGKQIQTGLAFPWVEHEA